MLITPPTDSPLAWLLPLLVGAILALVATPLVRWLAVSFGNIDRPVGNKIHVRPTPLMGGVAVYVAFAIGTLLFLPLSAPVVGLLAGGLAAVAVGLLDELTNLKPLWHLAGQAGAAAIAIVSGIGVLHSVHNPLAGLAAPGLSLPLALGVLVTLFWLVGMMNTVNFLDGLDGLASGVCLLVALLLAAWREEPHPYLSGGLLHHEDLILPLLLAGALLGFLPFNLYRARIFLGDTGAMFLGLAIAALSLVGPAKLGTALLVLIIPVLDVAWAIVRRQLKGRNFLSGDKQHVYHRMLELGLSRLSTVLLLYLLVTALAILDLVLFPAAKLIAFVLLFITIGASFVLLEVRATRRTRPAPGSTAAEATTPPRS